MACGKKCTALKFLPVFFVGYGIGGAFSYMIGGKGKPSSCEDNEILAAFETRYAERSLNACGYGSNALTAASHTKESSARYKKPYWKLTTFIAI